MSKCGIVRSQWIKIIFDRINQKPDHFYRIRATGIPVEPHCSRMRDQNMGSVVCTHFLQGLRCVTGCLFEAVFKGFHVFLRIFEE